MHKDVAKYIENVPEDKREHVLELRKRILRTFPNAEEAFESGFPVYKRKTDGEWLAGFAHGTKGVMFYLMDQKVLDRFEKRLCGLRTGRLCMKFREAKKLSLDNVRGLVEKMLAAAAKRCGE